MTEILTTRRLNRALLARQHLLDRARLPLTQVVEEMGGIQHQYAPSGYVGLWSRTAGFERDSLTRALEERAVIQGTLMRVTIHTVSAADYWPMTAGVRRARREWHERVTAGQRGELDMRRVAEAVREILREGPLRQRELQARLIGRGFPAHAAGWSHVWVDIVRVPPSGTWERRRADLYGLAEDWLPPTDQPTEQDGLRLLLRRYLGGFGPARLADFADWAGLPPATARTAVDEMDLDRYLDEHGRELLDVPGAPMPDEDTPAPIRFLPTWDATLLVNCRRTQILPERYRPLVFTTRTPHSVGTFLVDGQVAGTWRFDAKAGRVQTVSFGPLDPGTQRELDAEAEALAGFHRE